MGTIEIMSSETTLGDLMSLLSRRDYYSSARLRAGLLRDGSGLKLVGARCVLSTEKPEDLRELDYGSLVLIESSLSKEEFGDWVTQLAKEGSAAFGRHNISVKGDFEPRFDLSQKIVSSGNQFYPLSPLEWACTIFRYRLSVQANFPYSLDPKIDLPFYPDARTAWGDWIGVDPDRGDIFGTIVIYLPNMAGRIVGLELSPKSRPKRVVVSVKDGLERASSLKGKAFVQELYDSTLKPRSSISADLKFVKNKAQVAFGFRPGHVAAILFDKNDEIIDLWRGPIADTGTAPAVGVTTAGSSPIAYNPRQVFVVHGRDEGGKDAVCRLLEKSGLEAIVLQERPHLGRTLIEKLEDYGSVGYAVVILTGDDIGGLQEGDEVERLKPRARQNAIFELGIFLGKLGRGRVCVLYRKGVEIPSDLGGLGYVEMDTGGAWRMKLAREMDAAGMSFDVKKIAELS